jgi:hypothetical protein|tara:strand:+ start:627 stop:2012 length:1386 start_codon:yes stop_codon:yes gene_type:complete
MASIVTEALKQELIRPVLKNITTGVSPHFYLGLSKSQSWPNGSDSAPTPRQDVDEENDFRKGLQGVVKINAASFIIPRQNWRTGVIYPEYDDQKTLAEYKSNSIYYYVMTDAQDVYMCMVTGRDANGTPVPSTTKPQGQNNHIFGYSDGYRWKFLYTVSPLASNYYMTREWIPVQTIDTTDSNSPGTDLKQKIIQDTARRSEITSFFIESGGLNYTDSCMIKVNNVLDANILVTTDAAAGGAITKVLFASDSTTFHTQTDLDGALITTEHATGTNAIIRPILSNSMGIGASAEVDLRAEAILINSKITGDDSDFIVAQDFRQIGILKNIKDSHGVGGDYFQNNTGQALNSMNLTISSAFTKDKYIVGSISGAKAFVDNIVGSTIFYHQFDSTGYVDFRESDTVTEIGGSGAGDINPNLSKIKPEVHPRSGSILYIDNKSAIARVSGQTEDIKIIIKLDNCT